MNAKKTVAVFDFDGTITTKDTLLEFIKYSCGTISFYIGFLLYSPLLVLMKWHLYPNWKSKQKIFSWFFKGMSYSKFKQLGEDFKKEIENNIRQSIVNKVREHVAEGTLVYVVSASIDEWVRPFCKTLGVKDVLCTEIEVDKNGIITGRFLNNNCYGQEKVNRLLQVEPERDAYFLYAYGDSRGDKEMLGFADKGTLT